MGSAAELVLGGEPNAVPRARHFATSALAGEPETTIESAELLVAELVTNALLHGEVPVTLRLISQAGRVRIEVEDTGRAVPFRMRQNLEAMTGRGLSLVAAVASGWGIEPGASGGKVVWAELADGAGLGGVEQPELDVDALLASWTDDLDSEQRYTVNLGAVPTDLLLAAKAHIDNVVRELTLAKSEQAASGVVLPPPIAALIETVTHDFAEARREIKRQAVAAAAAGDTFTDLTLHLPASAADAGERYLDALEQADRYSRADRLLTVAPPRSHRTFRRWYVQALVDQLRAAARGEPPPTPRPFPQVLAEEVERLASLEDTWDRLQLLQKVTAELTDARSVTDIAATVVENAVEFLGAETSRVYLLTDDGRLKSIGLHADRGRHDAPYEEFDINDDLPGSVVVRTGEPLFFRNQDQVAERFPTMNYRYATERSLHVAPLIVGDHTLGVLSLTFAPAQPMDEATQIAFVGALADALAQALERALALERAAAANARLAFLADASVALSSSLDVEATVEAVTRLMVPTLADWCAVQLLQDGTLETVALRHMDPRKAEWGREMAGKFAVKMDAPSGAPVVLRTGVSEVYPEITDDLLESGAVNDDHLEMLREFGMSSGMVVPLSGRSGTFGVITLVYAESGRKYTETDVAFVEDVARRAALALETATTFREQSGRLASVTRVAEAAQRAILAQPPSRLGPVSLAARYVSAAREALIGGDLYEVVQRSGAVRMLIGDVRGKGLAAVRTATIVLGEFRAIAPDIADLGALAQQIDQRVRPYLAEEDFVTALLAEITEDGSYRVACCGHPAPLLVSNGSILTLDVEPAMPLGLGAEPVVSSGHMTAGDRLLLYTDGIVEARDSEGNFVDLMTVVEPVARGRLRNVLDQILDALHAITGPELGDDLALLVAEYNP